MPDLPRARRRARRGRAGDRRSGRLRGRDPDVRHGEFAQRGDRGDDPRPSRGEAGIDTSESDASMT